MSLHRSSALRGQRGVGLMEVLISIVIGMLLVLVIYQVYEISEGQKRTITSGSDAQQNASYGLYVMGRDVSMAGNGIASTAAALDGCTTLRPIPVLIEAGASGETPDKITVLYGGSPSLSTPVPFRATATGTAAYVVPGPVGFSANDVVAAVQGANCTVSTINTVAVDPATGFATLTHTLVPGGPTHTYTSGVASLVNLGQAASMGRVEYTVDPVSRALRTQNLLPDPAAAPSPSPIISEVVNLKAQYGVDTNCNGVLTWVAPTPAGTWSSANVAIMPLPATGCVPGTPSLRQIQAIRIAIVTRSTQQEFDSVTKACIVLTPGPIKLLNDTVTMNLTGSEPCYRYKVLETAIPLRNALWN